MHLLPVLQGSLDRDAAAVDLAQTPADILVLSFSDGDLSALASAVADAGLASPSLRLAGLAHLKHPFSVDLYVEKVASRARFVLVRLLGGLDYWRYGVEELAAAARRHGFELAAVPGCEQLDPRLDELSTLPVEDLRRLWRYFREGGPENLTQAFRFIAARSGLDMLWDEPKPLPAAAVHAACCRPGRGLGFPLPEVPHALVTFYRSALLADDIAPVEALADALQARGARVTAVSVTSLKDEAAAAMLARIIETDPPDVLLNTTAFSAQRVDGGTVLDEADAPVLQVIQSGGARDIWAASTRGLGAADLAMNVVLPEVDGRILGGVLSFKEVGSPDAVTEFAPVRHRPDPDRVSHIADLALAWARLRRTPRLERRLACVLSDYPGKAGRGGYAVGLDAPQSVSSITAALQQGGYDVEALPDNATVMTELTEGAAAPLLSRADYDRVFATFPEEFRSAVLRRWGTPDADPDLVDGSFGFRIRRAGSLVVAVQPDRGHAGARRADYHDTALPPRHGYIAFYVWLREVERLHALIHLGTHGTLEWLPGKAVALGDACAPEAVLGPVPVIYPFLVSDPGEAAQAKRRLGAVTVGHLTPPLVAAGSHGSAAELEALFDEYAEAQGLDGRRARLLGAAILDRARLSGLAEDCGIASDAAPETALQRLDAWLCDLKEARIGDGLHVFGGSNTGARGAAFEACGPAEMASLLKALDGRFVPPGPAGSPAGARRDVLPTGRNLYAVDPRAVPTRTAYEIGVRAAAEVLARYVQDHGEWPRRLVLDLWGSATMRTGGDDLGQAFALMGVRPRWDHGSTRVNGFEILPLARLDHPRIDVTLRISGLFRDLFPDQIALFDAAVRAVAGLDEDDDVNPLAAARRGAAAATMHRVFGAAPERYGLGLARRIAAGDWSERRDLGETYLAGSSHAYGGVSATGQEASAAFRDRVREADAHVHVADLPEVDLLSSDVAAEHQGGFAAAASALGSTPALYHADATVPGTLKVRSLAEEVARVVRVRAVNPRWIAGQMRHGFRGAVEIAETVDALYGFAATTDAVPSRLFDLLFDATLGDAAVCDFLTGSNPSAARSIADRFAEAATRGLWISRRNSTAALLAEMRAEP